MSDFFTTAAENFVAEQSNPDAASPEVNTGLAPSSESAQSQETPTQGLEKSAVSQAIAELDKMDKFKLDGQEWTLKDLKAAIMRQKDYTQKTQSLSEERKTLQEEKKFHENLAWDLQKMRDNPALANEFVKVYPQAFHKYAEAFLKTNNQPQGQQNVQQQPQVDVQLLSRVNTLEKFYQEQEVQKHEQAIEQTMTEMSAKYPDAANFREMVLGRAFEAQSRGTVLDKDTWETIFKQVDQEVSGVLKAKYSSLVKKQTEAHKKSQDVGAGGGAVGRAPVKFTKFDDLAKHAEAIAKGGS